MDGSTFDPDFCAQKDCQRWQNDLLVKQFNAIAGTLGQQESDITGDSHPQRGPHTSAGCHEFLEDPTKKELENWFCQEPGSGL